MRAKKENNLTSTYTFTRLLTLFSLFVFQILEPDVLAETRIFQGVVYDQDDKPLPGVVLTFNAWSQYYYVPIPFSKTFDLEKTYTAKTDSNGLFTIHYSVTKFHLLQAGITFVNASKLGYRQDGPETDYVWRPYGTGTEPRWTLHLVSEALIQQSQIRNIEFSSIPFFESGRVGLDLVDGRISDTTNADMVFEWRHLPATTNHGDYGKFSIWAPKGGVWFWEQDRLFAPLEGYEQGMTFLFGINFFGDKSFPYNLYPYRRRAEFYVKTQNGQVYARVYAELNTADHTLSLRARVNASGNRFVDTKGGAYTIGFYGSMSADYLNPGVPWWISMGPVCSQVIMPEDRLRMMATNFTAYFAGHYQTPPDILEWMANSNLIHDHYIPQYLARNYSAPTNVLEKLIEIDPNGNRWFGKDARAVLAAPEDVKSFLVNRNN